jgi:hypothetical protein
MRIGMKRLCPYSPRKWKDNSRWMARLALPAAATRWRLAHGREEEQMNLVKKAAQDALMEAMRRG